MHGWINCYKEKGLSSFDCVRKIKKLFGVKKVGHGGTLDPLAEGVLPVALGEATKLLEYVIDDSKEYEAKAHFGIQTTTGDSEGDVLYKHGKVPELEEIINILPNFIGDQTQIPHKYSAIKINGKRAYELSRSGIDFQIQPRKIHIFSIEILEFQKPFLRIKVKCSKGTYIRSLIEDIAKYLKTYSFTVELKRVKHGIFSLNSAQILDERTTIMPINTVLDDIPVYNASEEFIQRVRFGQKIRIDFPDSNLVKVLDKENLVSLGEIKDGTFFSKKIFNL